MLHQIHDVFYQRI